MIRVAVFDSDEANRELLRRWIVGYLVRENRELDMLWFTTTAACDAMEKYAHGIHFALISLDDENGEGVGKKLYSLNPCCRICYYRSQPCDLAALLPSRPISFYLKGQGEAPFVRMLDAVIQELSKANDMLRYETRHGLLMIPLYSIMYVQSDLKYVVIHKCDGTQHRLYAKLTQIEEKLYGFVRIHKSYIVNRAHVTCVDKKQRTLQLSDGQWLPISEAQYENTRKKLLEERRM